MLQVENRTPFEPAIALFPNADGIDSLYIVVKGTFSLSPRLALAEAQAAPTLTDEYTGTPGGSSLRAASELHVGKAGTDVLLMGTAYAPGAPVTESAVMVRVAERKKLVRVFGDRVWLPGGHSQPEPFEAMPLTFERTFGGRQTLPDGEGVLAEERNPVGVGFRGKRTASEMYGQPLPNLEDPAHPVREMGGRTPPACFGFVAPDWMPRRAFAGTFDEGWQQQRAPYLPLDFDRRFFNVAASELAFSRFLTGGEPVEVLGASRGPIRFDVPRCDLKISIKIARRTESPPLWLETILIEPDENRMTSSWRAELPCDREALKIRTIEIDGRVG